LALFAVNRFYREERKEREDVPKEGVCMSGRRRREGSAQNENGSTEGATSIRGTPVSGPTRDRCGIEAGSPDD
jgi:hypothetical protein